MKDKKRIFICRIHQESNAFNPVLATMEDFQSAGIYEGENVVKKDGKCGVTVCGIVDAFHKEDVELIGGVSMTAITSGGPVESAVVDWFLQKNIAKIQQVGQLDGVVVSLHGATVSDVSEDVCGDILQALRSVVGKDCIISASFDLHANITEKIMENADYVCGYQEYPHVDLYQTGYRAAKMLLGRLKGKDLKTVSASIPLIAPAHAYTTKNGSLLRIKQRAQKLVECGKIVDFTLFQAQPWLDVKELSSTAVVIGENEEDAKSVANWLIQEEFSIRRELQGEPLMSVEEVIEKALRNTTGKPIVLADSADSPAAGACGDSAYTLEALLPYKDKLRCAVAVTDKDVVAQAFAVGVGNTADFKIGGTLAPKITTPVWIKNAKVRSLHDGKFFFHGPQERGVEDNIGKTAILQVGKLFIHVCSFGRKGDLAFYRSFGIEPTFCDLICVKACTSFRAGYESIVSEICCAKTKGVAGGVLTELPYEKRPQPMYPFEEISKDVIKAAKSYR